MATTMATHHFLAIFFYIIISAICTQFKCLQIPRELTGFSQNIISFDIPTPVPSHFPSPPSIPPLTAPLASALFVIGDSSVHCGSSNFFGALARADRPPYGRDFDTRQPTGRFSNGRTLVDYLALRLGLPFVPSYPGQLGTVEDLIHGVNYASTGAGIIFPSGPELGQRISFSQQIQQLSYTLQSFIVNLGEEAAIDHISNSVIYISIGINDYIHYYFRNQSGLQNLFLPWRFSQFLASAIKHEIMNLHDLNVRKLVVMGLPPIGCAPHYLWKYKSKNGESVKEINDAILEFNFYMRYLIEKLVELLPDAKLAFCDMCQGFMDIINNHELYGFNVSSEACCGLGKYKGWMMCIAPEMACRNESSHIWWDQYHPTEAVNSILADNVWNGLHTRMCYPINLKHMVSNS